MLTSSIPVMPQAVQTTLGTDNNFYVKQNTKIKEVNSQRTVVNLDMFVTSDLDVPNLYLRDKQYNFRDLDQTLKKIWEYPYSKVEDSMYYVKVKAYFNKQTKEFEILEQDFRVAIFNGVQLFLTTTSQIMEDVTISNETFVKSVLVNLIPTLLRVENTVQFYKESQLSKELN